jgi:hypothetical protein
MKLRTATAAVSAAAMLTGCATSASRVVAVDVPASRYAALDCAAARAQLADRRAAESVLARRQDTAAQRDTAGVALIGLPVGSIFRGNVADELAQVKGEVRALEARVVTAC